MILYLDTSGLVKLYIEETCSATVVTAVEQADAVATSLLASVETRATLARARRETRLSSPAYRRVVESFIEDWNRYLVVDVTKRLVEEAGRLAEHHGLRGYGAVHLASAVFLREHVNQEVDVLAYDHGLMAAAQREGFRLRFSAC